MNTKKILYISSLLLACSAAVAAEWNRNRILWDPSVYCVTPKHCAHLPEEEMYSYNTPSISNDPNPEHILVRDFSIPIDPRQASSHKSSTESSPKKIHMPTTMYLPETSMYLPQTSSTDNIESHNYEYDDSVVMTAFPIINQELIDQYEYPNLSHIPTFVTSSPRRVSRTDKVRLHIEDDKNGRTQVTLIDNSRDGQEVVQVVSNNKRVPIVRNNTPRIVIVDDTPLVSTVVVVSESRTPTPPSLSPWKRFKRLFHRRSVSPTK